MLEERRRLLTRTIPFLLVGLILFLAYLYFFVGFSNIIETFSKVNLGIFLLAVLMTLIDVFLFTFTWHYLLKTVSINISFSKSLAYVLTGIFVDILIPAEAVSAEISKIYLMGREGADVGKVTATLVIQRIYGMVITASSMLSACLVLLAKMPTQLPVIVINLVLLASGLTLFFLILILLFCIKKELTKKIIRKILGFLKRILPKRLNIKSWEEMAKNALNTFFPALSFLAKMPKKLSVSIISAVSSWIFCLLSSQLVFYSLGYQISFPVVVIVYSISMIVQSIPAGIPAEVGITEIVMSSLYMLFSVDPPVAATATILIRFLTVWLKFIMGFMALQWVGIKVIFNKQKQIKQD